MYSVPGFKRVLLDALAIELVLDLAWKRAPFRLFLPRSPNNSACASMEYQSWQLHPCCSPLYSAPQISVGAEFTCSDGRWSEEPWQLFWRFVCCADSSSCPLAVRNVMAALGCFSHLLRSRKLEVGISTATPSSCV